VPLTRFAVFFLSVEQGVCRAFKDTALTVEPASAGFELHPALRM